MLMLVMIVIAVSPMEVGLLRPLRKKVSMVLSTVLAICFFICLVRVGLHLGMCCFRREIWCSAEVIRWFCYSSQAVKTGG